MRLRDEVVFYVIDASELFLKSFAGLDRSRMLCLFTDDMKDVVEFWCTDFSLF